MTEPLVGSDRAVARAVLVSVAGKSAELATLVLLATIVPRVLGPTDFGRFSVPLTVVTLGSLALTLGGHTVMARYVPAAPPGDRVALARRLGARLARGRGAQVVGITVAGVAAAVISLPLVAFGVPAALAALLTLALLATLLTIAVPVGTAAARGAAALAATFGGAALVGGAVLFGAPLLLAATAALLLAGAGLPLVIVLPLLLVIVIVPLVGLALPDLKSYLVSAIRAWRDQNTPRGDSNSGMTPTGTQFLDDIQDTADLADLIASLQKALAPQARAEAAAPHVEIPLVGIGATDGRTTGNDARRLVTVSI
jgi:hypothetical protein